MTKTICFLKKVNSQTTLGIFPNIFQPLQFFFSASVLTYDIFFKSLFNLNTGNVCFTENFFQPLRCSAKLIKSLNLATTLRKRIDNKEIYQSGLTLTI